MKVTKFFVGLSVVVAAAAAQNTATFDAATVTTVSVGSPRPKGTGTLDDVIELLRQQMDQQRDQERQLERHHQETLEQTERQHQETQERLAALEGEEMDLAAHLAIWGLVVMVFSGIPAWIPQPTLVGWLGGGLAWIKKLAGTLITWVRWLALVGLLLMLTGVYYVRYRGGNFAKWGLLKKRQLVNDVRALWAKARQAVPGRVGRLLPASASAPTPAPAPAPGQEAGDVEMGPLPSPLPPVHLPPQAPQPQ